MVGNERDAFAIAEARLGYSLNTEDPDELQAAADLLMEQKPLVQQYSMDNIYDAMDNEEVEVGLSCVAVPVFSAPGQVSCSISISGMTPRVRTALRGGLLDDLRQASADISRSLYGYQPADDLL